MNLDNYKFNITKASNNEFILSVKEVNYMIGEVVYIILKGSKNGDDEHTILNIIKKNKNYNHIEQEDIQALINDSIIPLLASKNIKKNNNPVKSLFILLRPSKYSFIINLFNSVFSPVFFWISFSITAAFSIYFFNANHTPINSLLDLKFGWIMTLIFTFFIIFFHELGHVVAASRYKIVAKEIGFGFYFIYPALYTDLTEIWKLHKKQRIIINLGGIYFQLIINIFLAGLITVLAEYKILLTSFFISNTAIIFFNLNPLFKFDAYWIFSDFFEIHNLRSQSNNVLLSVIKKRIFPKIELKKRVPLVVYAICYLVFMVLVWISIGRYFYNSIIDLYHVYSLNECIAFTNFTVIKKILWFIFTLLLVIRIIMAAIQIKKKIIKNTP